MDGTRLRDDLADLAPYDPDMRPVRVMLSANENNWGLPQDVRDELARRLADVPLNRYPDATAPRVRALLGELWGVPARDVVVGNGGDELIFDLLLALGGAGRTLVNCPPTFSAYELYARLTATRVVDVPRLPDFSVDEAAMRAAATRPDVSLVVLTSPNNPTGNLGRPGFVRELAQATEALVVVDEAYGEFCDPSASCMPLTRELPNVCVLRTLSKAYALAGARVGYVVCGDAVADGLLAVRQPYSVSRLDQVAAEVVLERRAELLPAVEAVKAERARLTGLLGALPGVTVWPSEANFVLVRVPDADSVHEALAARSILVRNFSHAPGLSDCLRVSVGRPEETDELVAALRELLA